MAQPLRKHLAELQRIESAQATLHRRQVRCARRLSVAMRYDKPSEKMTLGQWAKRAGMPISTLHEYVSGKLLWTVARARRAVAALR